jgi:hypothetical protein
VTSSGSLQRSTRAVDGVFEGVGAEAFAGAAVFAVALGGPAGVVAVSVPFAVGGDANVVAVVAGAGNEPGQ